MQVHILVFTSNSNNSCSSVHSFVNLHKKMDSNKASFNAGQAKGQVQEKTNNLMDRASDTAQSAKESMQEAGQQMMAKAQGAADAMKNATGMNK